MCICPVPSAALHAQSVGDCAVTTVGAIRAARTARCSATICRRETDRLESHTREKKTKERRKKESKRRQKAREEEKLQLQAALHEKVVGMGDEKGDKG